MLCQDIMKRNVECLDHKDTAETAARIMRELNIGFLPVCDGNRVLGVVTDRDLAIRVLADGRGPETRIDKVMTGAIVFCRPEDELHTAEWRMAENHVGRMLVLDDDRQLVGVISLSDISVYEQSTRAADTLRQVSRREAHVM